MRETQIIDRIRGLARVRHPSVVRGIGDDCAILRPRPNEDLVFTSDFVLEDRHFTLETHTAARVGHKALARSLSDVAAMGAEPVFCLVSLAVPAARGARWIQRFYKGFLALADQFAIPLAGGDLARFDKVVVDVMCCGRLPRGEAMLRSAAKPGDRIYVTGQLGEAAHSAWRRPLLPEPRIAAGVALRRLGVVAAIDLSDGLSLDLARLCRESKVSAELSANLPVARGASLDDALHGGEDYELLFAAPSGKRIPAAIGSLRVTPIGVITRGHPGQVKLDGRPIPTKGFDHFA